MLFIAQLGAYTLSSGRVKIAKSGWFQLWSDRLELVFPRQTLENWSEPKSLTTPCKKSKWAKIAISSGSEEGVGMRYSQTSPYHPESVFRERLAMLFIAQLGAYTLSSGRVKIAKSGWFQLWSDWLELVFPRQTLENWNYVTLSK